MVKQIGRLRWRRTSLLCLGCASFLVGIGLARWGTSLSVLWLVPVTGSVIFLGRRQNCLLVALILLLCLSLGLWRGAQYRIKLATYQTLWGQPVRLQGQATEDGVYGKNGQLTFDLTQLTRLPSAEHLVGRIGVAGFGETAVYRGDVVEVSGRLYTARGSRQGRVQFGLLKVISRDTSLLQRLRRRFVAAVLTVLPEPHASLGLGLLIGQRNTLPAEFSQQLTAVGLTHIIAVSGYNLTIIVRAVRRLLEKRSKYQTVAVAGLLIIFFVSLSGLSASLLRAALVSGFSLWAWYYGRTFKPLVLLLGVAALTAGWSPLYLWFDTGWYLSFLAFYGVLVLAPAWQRRWPLPAGLIGQLVAETMAAQLMTMPLIMYVFGQVSVWALLANIVVVPLVPLVMLLTLVAGLAGMIIGSLAGWLAWPARLGLTYIIDLVTELSRWPHALAHKSLTILQMLVAYALIWSGVFWLSRTKRPQSDKITE